MIVLKAAVGALIACAILGMLYYRGVRRHRRLIAALEARRPSPAARDGFAALLADDCEEDIAHFLWDELTVYWAPIAPHPDDHLTEDLAIDPDEPTDWLARFCRAQRIRASDFEPMADGQPPTIRNFARWLSRERGRLAPSAEAARTPASLSRYQS